jgi:hypothetical protein
MGCSQSLTEHTTYSEYEPRHVHYHTFNGKWCGLSIVYRADETIIGIYNYHNNMLTGPCFEFYGNELLKRCGHCTNNIMCDCKTYDESGSLIQSMIRGNRDKKLCAIYNNDKLCTYYTEQFYQEEINILYNNTIEYDIILNSSFINAIRHLQRHFRRRKYVPIWNELNTVIGVSDIAQLILSYVTKN